MTGEEDSEVLSRNLSTTINSNSNFNNQTTNSSSTSSVIRPVSKRDDKVDNGQGNLSQDGHKDPLIVNSHCDGIKHSNHLDSVARVKDDDDTEGFGSVDDFDDDDDDDGMQIDLSRPVDSPEEGQEDGRDSVNNFSVGEQDVSGVCTSTSGGSNVNLVESVNTASNVGGSLRSPLLPLPSLGSLGACNSAVGGRTPGQVSRSDSQSQDLIDDPDVIILTPEEVVALPQEKFSHVYGQLGESYRNLDCKLQDSLDEIAQLKDTVQRTQLQASESARRENFLVMRLTTKEQEMQEYITQVNELKSAIAPTVGSLRSTLLDPAVNLIILKMKKELEETKKKLEDTQNDLNAWKFTPDSNTGKRLMAKCRMLYQENEELGKMISSGRLAKLESDLALQKSLTEEMKKSQSELDELVQELDEDVEGMQSTVCFLQQQLRDSKQSANSNSSRNHSVSETELVTVNVTELCAQCRVIQDKKNQQDEESQNLENSNVVIPPVKLENSSPNSSPSSSCEPPITQTRTWVNGEIDDSVESDRKPLGINSKLNHLVSKVESKSNFNHGDCPTNDAAVDSVNHTESTACSVSNSVQINQSVKVMHEIEDGLELSTSTVRQKRKLPSRGDLSNYDHETVTPVMKRTKRTYASSLQINTPVTGSSSINSNVIVNSSSVSLRNSAGEPAPFPSSSSSFNNPTTANGNGSLEH